MQNNHSSAATYESAAAELYPGVGPPMALIRGLRKFWLIAILLVAAVIAGCGSEDSGSWGYYQQTFTPPTVTATNPANGQTGVAINQSIAATFSKPMDPSSINPTTFLVTGPGTTPVPGTLAYAGLTSTFTPASNLAANTLYTVTLTTGVWDGQGIPLAATNSWSFTTGAAPDTIAPTVTFTDPAQGDVGEPTNRKISATFSEGMDPTTINNVNFRLTGPGLSPVLGTVIYVGPTATFTPTSSLAFSTLYTATITTAAKDLAGNPMAANFVWTFTTGAAPDTIAPTVTATDPANAATGVASNKKIAATFSEAMDPLTINNVNFTLTGPGATTVPGAVTYAGLTATFTPTNSLAFNTLYTGKITTAARDLAGNPLAANFSWSFTTGAAPDILAPTVTFLDPANGATGVPGNKKVAATFSEAMDPLTITNVNFKLAGPGVTPVAGTVAYVGPTATFTPAATLAFNTLYTATITTAVKDLAGNPMAANFSWSFTTGAAPDTLAPTVTSTDPANLAVGVAANKKVNATFSEAMNPLTITNVNYTLTGPGATPVAGTVTYVGLTATFTPTANLAFNTLYTATITTAAKDQAGNPMATNFSWRFTTGAAPDTLAPTVSSTDPANGATGVPGNKKVAATFSEAMDPLTITNVNFKLAGPGVTPVAGTVAYVGLTATFSPTANLAFNTLYTATVTTAVKDLAGNPMAANYSWSFTTGAAPDTLAPTVTSTDPANLAVGVAINKKVAATFSEGMDPLTITNVNYTLTGPGATPVAGTVTYVGQVATFSPTSSLAGNTLYTATITTGVRDLAGNPLAANFTWTFTTGAVPDTTAPTVTLTNPANLATDVPINRSITATFSEGMDPTTINNANFTVAGVPATVTYNALTKMATLKPTANLAVNTLYTATITTGARDLAGNALAANFSWTFTTGIRTEAQPVVLGAAAPFGTFGGGAGMTNQGILTVVNGDIGTTGASTTITGFHDKNATYTETPLNIGFVTGTIYTATAPPGSTNAAQGALDARTAYNNLLPAALPGGIHLGTDQLGGLTLAPGIYQSEPGTYQITGSDLTLDAKGDPNAVWVFQMATSLTVGGPGAAFPRNVILTNGAQAKNVFWQVGSAATINAGGGGTMVGTIIAEAGVTFSTAGNVAITTLNGRALGLNASVTLVNTVINTPAP